MKKFVLLMATGLLLVINSSGQEMNQVVFSEKTNSNILLGYCDRDGFAQGEFQTWFDMNYESYSPDQKALENLRNIDKQKLTVKIVLGTWCPDSRREVPVFFRVADEIGIPDEKLSIICVNRMKEFPGTDISHLDINFVPTFIFFRSGTEIGRIIESPAESIENDILKILAQ
ncbi:MAG: thioredoxin family protein [Bacteroidota bacterium]|nr:thioredoxin family protein [Bacteroidota bacterium]